MDGQGVRGPEAGRAGGVQLRPAGVPAPLREQRGRPLAGARHARPAQPVDAGLAPGRRPRALADHAQALARGDHRRLPGRQVPVEAVGGAAAGAGARRPSLPDDGARADAHQLRPWEVPLLHGRCGPARPDGPEPADQVPGLLRRTAVRGGGAELRPTTAGHTRRISGRVDNLFHSARSLLSCSQKEDYSNCKKAL